MIAEIFYRLLLLCAIEYYFSMKNYSKFIGRIKQLTIPHGHYLVFP